MVLSTWKNNHLPQTRSIYISIWGIHRGIHPHQLGDPEMRSPTYSPKGIEPSSGRIDIGPSSYLDLIRIDQVEMRGVVIL